MPGVPLASREGRARMNTGATMSKCSVSNGRARLVRLAMAAEVFPDECETDVEGEAAMRMSEQRVSVGICCALVLVPGSRERCAVLLAQPLPQSAAQEATTPNNTWPMRCEPGRHAQLLHEACSTKMCPPMVINIGNHKMAGDM